MGRPKPSWVRAHGHLATMLVPPERLSFLHLSFASGFWSRRRHMPPPLSRFFRAHGTAPRKILWCAGPSRTPPKTATSTTLPLTVTYVCTQPFSFAAARTSTQPLSSQPRVPARGQSPCSHPHSRATTSVAATRASTRPLPSQPRTQHATTSFAVIRISNMAVAAVAILSPSSLKGSSTACLGSAAQLTAAPPIRWHNR